MEAATSRKTEYRVDFFDGGIEKVNGITVGIIVLRVRERDPASSPLASDIATHDIKMMCHAVYRDSIIKNLKRMRQIETAPPSGR